MAALPELPEPKGRNLESLWTDVIREYGFTGEHLRWHESPDRRFRAAEPAYHVHSWGQHDGPHGEEISRELALELRRKLWDERLRDPAIIDSIGVDESTRAAAHGLEAFAEVYFQAWIEKPGAEYYEFCDWLEGIATNIENRLRELWDPRGDWYARVCSAEVRDTLAPHIKAWREKALSWLKQRPARLLREFEETLRRGQETLARPLPSSGALAVQPSQPDETSLLDMQRQFHEDIRRQVREDDASNRRMMDSMLDEVRALRERLERPAQEAANKSLTTEDQSKSAERAAEDGTEPNLEAQAAKHEKATIPERPQASAATPEPAIEAHAPASAESHESELLLAPKHGAASESAIQVFKTDLEVALRDDKRKEASQIWMAARSVQNLPATKVALYNQAGQDKADYYRWERGELKEGSQADIDIRKALFAAFK